MKLLKFFPVMFLTAGLFVACGGEHKEAASDANTEQIAAVDTVHAYICPMHCENSASMEPGTCKVCGMDLVKNPDYKGATADSTSTVPDSTTGAHTHDNASEGHEGHNH